MKRTVIHWSTYNFFLLGKNVPWRLAKVDAHPYAIAFDNIIAQKTYNKQKNSLFSYFDLPCKTSF